MQVAIAHRTFLDRLARELPTTGVQTADIASSIPSRAAVLPARDLVHLVHDVVVNGQRVANLLRRQVTRRRAFALKGYTR